MVILHIASLTIQKLPFTGISVAVPQHIIAQQQFAEVGLINVSGEPVKGIINQFSYSERFVLSDLPRPYSEPDVVVFHEVYRPAFLKIAKQLKKHRVPYVVVPHGCLTKEAQSKKRVKKIAGNVLLFNSFLKRAAAIQYLSEQERNNSRFGKVKIIGTNGITLPGIRNTGSGEDGINLLYIGSLALQIKGLDLMLQAVGSVAECLRKRDARLYLYGPNYKTRHADICGLVRYLKIGDLVVLNDAVFGEEKRAALLNADLFIQTSRSEGMSMGILEALGYGIPCLVTKGTNLGEIIERYDAGWVAETDAASIAETILKALNEQDCWEEKSRNAVRLIEENFRWETVAQATVEEYRKLLN